MINIIGKDLFLNALGFVLLLLILILPFINEPAKDIPNPPPPGSLAVLAAWPEGPIDVDLWLKSPDDDKPVGYPPGLKSRKHCALLRDDLGTTGDGGPFNAENAFCRSLPAGEYTVNIHGYSVPAAGVNVHVEISLDGRLLVKSDMDLNQKQEITVIRFRLDGAGNVVPGSVNHVFRPLRGVGK